ncbi:FmdB family zinc ribbon protein [Pajaroellobacter abortibovis]|uniref:FmdB family zinc ribbon protein n=1 Tax=Pajaroellobacter abortibovis TaxID=1882918 RepID=UPI00094AFB0D
MPTYEYTCSQCQYAWEEIQKITEAPLHACPRCNANSAKRQVSGGNFILKGGGWYADLYSSPKPASTSEKKGESTAKDTQQPLKKAGEASLPSNSSTPPATSSSTSASVKG